MRMTRKGAVERRPNADQVRWRERVYIRQFLKDIPRRKYPKEVKNQWDNLFATSSFGLAWCYLFPGAFAKNTLRFTPLFVNPDLTMSSDFRFEVTAIAVTVGAGVVRG